MYLKKQTVINKSFRRSRNSSDDVDKAHKQNINDFINDQLNCMRLCSMKIYEKENEQFLKDKYSE